MMRNKFQIIPAVFAVIIALTALLPGSLQAYWRSCGERWVGCSKCLYSCPFDGCDNHQPAYNVTGTASSGSGRLIKYDADCCELIPRSYLPGCAFEPTYSPDWGTPECGSIPYMCGDRRTSHLLISEWICPTVTFSAVKNPLSPGDTVTVTAYGMETAGGSPVWNIISEKGDAEAEIAPNGNSATVYVSDDSGEGWLKIQVADPSSDCPPESETLYVGCGSCGSATCSSVDNGSIDVRMGLGKSEQGNLAGHIVLRAETPDPANADTEALEVLKFGSDTEILYDGTAPRQVVSPERFVSIATVDEYRYTVIFYSPDAMGDKVNGFYEIAEGAEPFVSWTVENPDREAAFSRLKLTEDTGTVQKVYEYVWDETESAWTLDKGNGLQIIAKKKETVSGSPVETEIVKNASGAVASEKKTTYKEITCGDGTRERVTEETTDPGGDALTVTSDYYEDSASESCGRLKSKADSDGSWVRYEYDSEGRKSAVISSWLDAPEGADASAARAVYYDYTPQDASDSDDPGDVRRPRKIAEKIQGITVSQKYYVYTVDSSGKRTEISEQCAEQPCSYGDPENLRTVAVTHPYTDGYPGSWQPESIVYPDGRKDSFTYSDGRYMPADDPGSPGSFHYSGDQSCDNPLFLQ